MGPQRYTEDYSYLRDPSNRTGAWWERLKFVPLDSAGRIYLTFGDEARLRYEHYENNQFGSGTKPTESYFRYRQMPYAGIQLGPAFRVFTQAIVAYGTRSRPKNPFVDETGVELLQGFADGRIPLGAASHLTLRAGRQVLVYGSGRLLNAGPNIRTTFDGGLASLESPRWRVDAFYARPVRPELGSFDDGRDRARRLWSLYATRTRRAKPPAGLDLYYVGYESEAARFNQGTGHERRHSFGARFFDAVGAWTLDVEAALQVGRFGGADLRAWGMDAQWNYTFRAAPLAPFLGLRAGAVSGDDDPRDDALGTFSPMFPEGGYFGEGGVVGPLNLVHVHPAVGVAPAQGWTLMVSPVLFWRQSLRDGAYGIDGTPFRPDGGSRARYVGTELDVSTAWSPNRNVTLYAAWSILWPGRFIRDTGPAEVVQFVGTHAQFRY